MESVAEVWTNVLNYIQKNYVDGSGEISQIAFTTWICCFTMQSLDNGDVAVLTAKNDFQISTGSKYSPYIKEAFKNVLGFPVTLKMLPAVFDEESSYTLRSLYSNDTVKSVDF